MIRDGELVRVRMRQAVTNREETFWQTWPIAVGDVRPVRNLPGVWTVTEVMHEPYIEEGFYDH